MARTVKLRQSKRRSRRNEPAYMQGWIRAEEPLEPYFKFAGYAWSELFVTVRTHRIFKRIRRSGLWYRFTVVRQED